VSASTAALYCFASAKIRRALASPDSKLVELIKQRPGVFCSAASMTSGSVESIISGTGTSNDRRLTNLAINSASLLRSVSATLTSNPCAPFSTCSRAICSMPSKSSASSKRLKAREPCAFSRSPTKKGTGCCSICTACTGEANSASGFSAGRSGRAWGSLATSSRICSGRVPQQPPTTRTPYSRTYSARRSENGSGRIG